MRKIEKKILLNEIFGRQRTFRRGKNDKICADCGNPFFFENSISCERCHFKILAEKLKITETRSKVQNLSRKLFNELELTKQEIINTKDRIYAIDYDIEVSDIRNQRGHIIY